MTADKLPAAMPPPRGEIWSSITAALLTACHVVLAITVFGWFYFVVPGWKKELDELGMAVTQMTMLIIQQSDALVNYWYLLVPLAPAALVVDFIFLRWMAKYLGKPSAVVIGLCGAALILSGMWIGHSVLTQELSRLRVQAAAVPVQTQSVENTKP